MSERRIYVAHIVPAMDVGGVEIGISRSFSEINREFVYEVYYVRRRGNLDVGQQSVLRLLKKILLEENKPDIILTSLWWSHLFGWIVRSRIRPWVAFFHSAGFFYRVDSIVCRWAWRRADKCLVDSVATRGAISKFLRKPDAVIPYIFEGQGRPKSWSDRTIDIIWVGRNHSVKRLDILVRFLLYWNELQPNSRVVVAYSGDPLTPLEPLATGQSYGVNRPRITFLKNAPHQQVLDSLGNARFFLLFSDQEGMSMSTVEAVQAGCVSVVRPVGEIPRYLDEQSAILVPGVSDPELKNIAKRMMEMLENPAEAVALSQQAQKNIDVLPRYTESLIRALNAVSVSPRH